MIGFALGIPVEVVVEYLDRGCLQAPRGFLRDRNENCRVWLAENEAFFATPFKFVAGCIVLFRANW